MKTEFAARTISLSAAGADNFEEKASVVAEPLVEQALLVIILHRIRFAILLVANSDRILTTGEAVIEQFQFSVDVFSMWSTKRLNSIGETGSRCPRRPAGGTTPARC